MEIFEIEDEPNVEGDVTTRTPFTDLGAGVNVHADVSWFDKTDHPWVTFFIPFWIVNHSGLDLIYSDPMKPELEFSIDEQAKCVFFV